MEFIYICTMVLLAFAAESASALECYTCMTEPYFPYPGGPTQAPGANNCNDPFNMEGIAKDTCMGKCFASVTTSSTEGGNITISQRGCTPPEEACFAGCQSMSGGAPPQAGDGDQGQPPQAGDGDQGPPMDGPPPGESGTMCRYCCEGNLCNDMPIAETAAQQAPPPVEGSRMCWQCEQPKADATAGSCASDEFNGEGATKVNCNGQCVKMEGQNEQKVDMVRRDCDDSPGGQMCQQPGAECCLKELCNGSDGDDDDNDGEDEPIECWKCNATDTTESVCAKGEFEVMDKDTDKDKDMDAYAMVNYTKVTCPTGKCISMISTPSANVQLYIRDCVMSQMKEICEEGAEDNDKFKDMYKEIKCCEKHLCNGAPVVVSSSAAIFVGTLFVFFAFM